MSAAYFPCDVIEEMPPLDELRELVEEYDDLFERCMSSAMSMDEQHLLNELHEALSLMEDQYWTGVPYEMSFVIADRLDIEFPMIRFELGILPGQNNNQEGARK